MPKRQGIGFRVTAKRRRNIALGFKAARQKISRKAGDANQSARHGKRDLRGGKKFSALNPLLFGLRQGVGNKQREGRVGRHGVIFLTGCKRKTQKNQAQPQPQKKSRALVVRESPEEIRESFDRQGKKKT